MEIKMVSSVIIVKDIQTSRRFYEEVLHQQVLVDHGPNVGFTGGFAIWQVNHAHQILFGKQMEIEGPIGMGDIEIYFETEELEEACRELEKAGVEYVHPLTEQPWGQRVVRFYDPDHHIIEIGEPIPAVVRRFLSQGMAVEEISRRTSMPVEIVRQMM